MSFRKAFNPTSSHTHTTRENPAHTLAFFFQEEKKRCAVRVCDLRGVCDICVTGLCSILSESFHCSPLTSDLLHFIAAPLFTPPFKLRDRETVEKKNRGDEATKVTRSIFFFSRGSAVLSAKQPTFFPRRPTWNTVCLRTCKVLVCDVNYTRVKSGCSFHIALGVLAHTHTKSKNFPATVFHPAQHMWAWRVVTKNKHNS